MITDYIGGEGSAETPKNDYVIYGWPLTEDPIRKSKFLTNASGATWWPNFSIMQVMPPGGQNLKGRSKPRVSGWVTFFSEFICRQENWLGRWENYFGRWENYFGRWKYYFGRWKNYFGTFFFLIHLLVGKLIKQVQKLFWQVGKLFWQVDKLHVQ